MNRVRMQVGLEEISNSIGNRNDEALIDGSGVTVAVLDSGVWSHPDLSGRIVAFHDFISGKKQPYDNNGHGTHICGIICGNGMMSGGKYCGIAPGCRLVVGKVLDHKGEGMTQYMLEGLEWILDNKDRYQIKIVNISVGVGNLTDEKKEEALKKKIEEVWDSGIIVVCAAGNKGPADGSISSVGSSRKVITVGCHDGIYCMGNPKRCETYSGRGPFTALVRKPDLVAPGTDICSCNVLYQIPKAGRNVEQYYYTIKSGTSMATPVISGAAALLLQKQPQLSNESVKLRMTYTADDLGIAWNQQGWGMINIKKLLERY